MAADQTIAYRLAAGDVFKFAPADTTEWVVTERSAYSDGSLVIHANGLGPDWQRAVFELNPALTVFLV